MTSATTYSSVWARVEDQITSQPLGIVIPDRNMTLERYVMEKWLPRRANKPVKTQWREGSVDPKTGRRRGILFLYVLPKLGWLPLVSITPEHIDTMLLDLARRPAKRTGKPMGATARRTLNVLRKLFNDAKRLGYYSHDNLCSGVGHELPDYRPKWWVPSLEGFCRLICAVPAQWRALPFVALLILRGL